MYKEYVYKGQRNVLNALRRCLSLLRECSVSDVFLTTQCLPHCLEEEVTFALKHVPILSTSSSVGRFPFRLCPGRRFADEAITGVSVAPVPLIARGRSFDFQGIITVTETPLHAQAWLNVRGDLHVIYTRDLLADLRDALVEYAYDSHATDDWVLYCLREASTCLDEQRSFLHEVCLIGVWDYPPYPLRDYVPRTPDLPPWTRAIQRPHVPQVEAYNRAMGTLLETLKDAFGDAVDVRSIEWGRPQMPGCAGELTPQKAAEQHTTFGRELTVQVSMNDWAALRISLGVIPIMVGSDLSDGALSSEFVDGGFFIIDGMPKVIVFQERRAPYKTIVEKKEKSWVASQVFPRYAGSATIGEMCVTVEVFKDNPREFLSPRAHLTLDQHEASRRHTYGFQRMYASFSSAPLVLPTDVTNLWAFRTQSTDSHEPVPGIVETAADYITQSEMSATLQHLLISALRLANGTLRPTNKSSWELKCLRSAGMSVAEFIHHEVRNRVKDLGTIGDRLKKRMLENLPTEICRRIDVGAALQVAMRSSKALGYTKEASSEDEEGFCQHLEADNFLIQAKLIRKIVNAGFTNPTGKTILREMDGTNVGRVCIITTPEQAPMKIKDLALGCRLSLLLENLEVIISKLPRGEVKVRVNGRLLEGSVDRSALNMLKTEHPSLRICMEDNVCNIWNYAGALLRCAVKEEKVILIGVEEEEQYISDNPDSTFPLGLCLGYGASRLPFFHIAGHLRMVYASQNLGQAAANSPDDLLHTTKRLIHAEDNLIYTPAAAFQDSVNNRPVRVGQNLLVAFCTHMGKNIEDGIVCNEEAVKNGMLRTNVKVVYREKDTCATHVNSLETTKHVGDHVEQGTTLIKVSEGFTSIFRNPFKGAIREREAIGSGTVTHSSVIDGESTRHAIVVTEKICGPLFGNKVVFPGQKGTVGFTQSPKDWAIECETGMIPALLVNPHATISRMTPNLLCYGAQAMEATSPDTMQRQLEKPVDEVKATRLIYRDGRTGELIKHNIEMSLQCVMALKQHAPEKMYGQAESEKSSSTYFKPKLGKKNKGGVLFGKMETAAAVAHEAPNFVHEIISEHSDARRYWVGECGCIASLPLNSKQRTVHCPDHGEQRVAQARLPHFAVRLTQLLRTMGVRCAFKNLVDHQSKTLLTVDQSEDQEQHRQTGGQVPDGMTA